MIWISFKFFPTGFLSLVYFSANTATISENVPKNCYQLLCKRGNNKNVNVLSSFESLKPKVKYLGVGFPYSGINTETYKQTKNYLTKMDWIFYYWLEWWHHFPKHDHLSSTKQEHTSLRKNKYVICFLIRYKAISLNVSDFSRKFDAISNLWTAQASQNGAEHHSSWLSASLSIPRDIVSKSNQLFEFGSPCRTEPMEFSNIGANNSSKLGMSMILDHWIVF